MSWYPDEAYQTIEISWRVEPGQDFPNNLSDPLFVPAGRLP
jgi:hypothetical protein